MLHRLIRHISPLALVAIMMAVVSGCTHNNGDIGPLFGSWTLQEIVILRSQGEM